MENKQKPSVLEFISNHHLFDEPGVCFEPEMLSWPFFYEDEYEEINDKFFIKIHRDVISAFTTISPFNVKISMEANKVKQRLIHAKRTWAKIYLNDQCVLCFSHDTRESNRAFVSLYEWPELDKDKSRNWEQIIRPLYLWTVDQWSNFFKERLLKKAQDLKTKAIAKRNDALELEGRADTLLWALAEDVN